MTDMQVTRALYTFCVILLVIALAFVYVATHRSHVQIAPEPPTNLHVERLTRT
jgi:hypothetical protein